MKDYEPIIGKIEGNVEISTTKEEIELQNTVGFFMHKHNIFELFLKEDQIEQEK